MTGLEMFLWGLAALVAVAMLAAAAGVGLLLYAAAKAEIGDPIDPAAAEAPDNLGADILPDGAPAVQRSRLWPPGCRLGEDYIEAAESAYDWKAAEADVVRRRSR